MTPIRLALLACAALILAACGGSDSDDVSGMSNGQLADSYLEQMDSIADALDIVHDEASAEEAAAAIRAANERIDALAEEFDADLSGPQAMMLFMSRRNEIMQTQMRLATSLQRLNAENPELMREVSEAMSETPTPGQ